MKPKISNASTAEVLNVLGLSHAVLVGNDDNPSSYEFIMITGPAGIGVPTHVHKNEDETFYVAEGEVVFTIDGHGYRARSGTAVNLPRGVPHGFQNVAPNSRMALTISPGNLVPMFRELAGLPAGEPDLKAVATICGKFGVHFL